MDLSEKLIKYLSENQNKTFLLSKEEVQDQVEKKSSLFSKKSQLQSTFREWSKKIPLEDVILCMDLYKNSVGFIFSKNHFILYSTINSRYQKLEYKDFLDIKLDQGMTSGEIRIRKGVQGVYKYPFSGIKEGEPNIHTELNLFKKIIKEYINETDNKKEEVRLKKLDTSKNEFLSSLDINDKDEINLVDYEGLNELIKKNQKLIIEVDKEYLKNFVKIVNHLKTKKQNISSIYNLIKDVPNEDDLNTYGGVLVENVNSYNNTLYCSLQMIVSIIEDDMMTFYELYEGFDQENIFDSQHEKEISNKLSNVDQGLEKLFEEVKVMGKTINDSLNLLTRVTVIGNNRIEKQLSSINSKLNLSNLLQSIQVYQNSKK